jgi:hypothetical protein
MQLQNMEKCSNGRCSNSCWVRVLVAISFLALMVAACAENSPVELDGLPKPETPEATLVGEDLAGATMEPDPSNTQSNEGAPAETKIFLRQLATAIKLRVW